MLYFIHNVLRGENIVNINKIHRKYWSAFFGYFNILDLINVQKLERIKIGLPICV